MSSGNPYKVNIIECQISGQVFTHYRKTLETTAQVNLLAITASQNRENEGLFRRKDNSCKYIMKAQGKEKQRPGYEK